MKSMVAFAFVFLQITSALGAEPPSRNPHEVVCVRNASMLGNIYVRSNEKKDGAAPGGNEWSLWVGRDSRPGEVEFRSGITQFPVVLDCGGGYVIIIYESLDGGKKCGQFLVCKKDGGGSGFEIRSKWYSSFDSAVKDLPNVLGFLQQKKDNALFSDGGDPWALSKWIFPQ